MEESIESMCRRLSDLIHADHNEPEQIRLACKLAGLGLSALDRIATALETAAKKDSHYRPGDDVFPNVDVRG